MKKRQRGAFIGALLFLSACEKVGIEMPDFKMPDMSFFRTAPTDSASMYLGLAKVQAPDGFCIDRSASQLATGFALMVPCTVLDNSFDFPQHSAFITLQMGGRGTAGIAGTENFLRDQLQSDNSGNILSDQSVVEILETDIEDGAVAVHYRVEQADRTAALSDDVWRVFADVDGRLTTISLRGFKSAPLTVDDGRALLYRVLRGLREVNA